MLRQANRVKRITASGGGDLECPSGKSYLVKAVYCIASTNDTYLTLSVDRVTVGFYRVKGRAGNHLQPIVKGYRPFHLMEYLAGRGINVAIPVCEGQTFNVSRYAETGNVIIVFDEHDAADLRPDMVNGSEGKEYNFLQYMSTSETPTGSQDVTIDTSLSPAEFPDFPAGKAVPANHTITLLGLFGCPFTTGAAGPENWGTSFVKLIKDREVLFDPDRNGIPFDGQDATATADAYMGNFTLIGPGVPVLLDTAVKPWGEPLLFDPPIEFAAGEELNVLLSGVMVTGAQWEESLVDLGCILNVKKG